MAADTVLLERAEAGESCGRVYSWSQVWVTLGRFQHPERDLLIPIDWTRRPTGGKAVLHGHDVTVAIARPLSELGLDGRSLRAVYRALIAPLVATLNELGCPSVLGDASRYAGRGVRTADCFAFTSGNDVVDPMTGHKRCGCALRITESAALLQASIPVRPPLVDPATVFPHAAEVVLPDREFTPELFRAAMSETVIISSR